jgi:hypothetical protein
MRVRATKDALIPLSAGHPKLPRPGDSARRTEKLRPRWATDRSFRLLEISGKFSLRVGQNRTVRKVVVRDLVSGGFDLCDHLRVARGSLANQKESCRGIVLLQNLQHLGCEDRVRPIIEGKRDQRIVGSNSVNKFAA